MNDVKVGTLTASASAVNVEVGFIPDVVHIIDRDTPSLSISVVDGNVGLNIAAAAAAEAAGITSFTGQDGLADLTGTLAATADSPAVTGTSTLFTTELVVGEHVQIEGVVYEVIAIASATALTLGKGIEGTISGYTAKRYEGRGEGFTVPAAYTANTTGTLDFIAYR